MNPIDACLKMLKNLPVKRREIERIKILIACYDWTKSREIRTKAGLADTVANGAQRLAKEGWLECKKEMTVSGERTKRLAYFYRTTKKGTDYLAQLLK